jgi:putative phosphoesterase
MRILVVSDTHRDAHALRQAILKQPKAEVVIHLGDGAEEAQEMKDRFPEKMFLTVRGNCDWGCTAPVEELAVFGGKRIFFTHGYTYQVKYDLNDGIAAARERKADIFLFGHTHIPLTDYQNGLYIMNPGSLHGSMGSYGIIDITEAGIVTSLLKI